MLEGLSHDDDQVLDVYCLAVIFDGWRDGDGGFCDGRSTGPTFF